MTLDEEIARYLRDEPGLAYDQCSNVTGIDWRDREVTDTVKDSQPGAPGGPPVVVERKVKRIEPGYLEVVYHLYSLTRREGPVVLRLRTGNRSTSVSVPSLTPATPLASSRSTRATCGTASASPSCHARTPMPSATTE